MTNQEPKPSPGPWKYEQSHLLSDGVEFRLTTEHGQTLGWVYDSEANARLIVQAPELLRELVGAVENMRGSLVAGKFYEKDAAAVSALEEAIKIHDANYCSILAKIEKLEGGDG